MTATPLPHRRYTLRLEAHADDWSSLLGALDDVSHALELAGPKACRTTSGGTSRGWRLEVDDDPGMTSQRYRDELLRWLEGRTITGPQDGEVRGDG